MLPQSDIGANGDWGAGLRRVSESVAGCWVRRER
jgi:hypothetical protein